MVLVRDSLLGTEHGLRRVSLDEGLILLALLVTFALFDDRKVEHVGKIRVLLEEVAVVLERNGESSLMRRSGEPYQVVVLLPLYWSQRAGQLRKLSYAPCSILPVVLKPGLLSYESRLSGSTASQPLLYPKCISHGQSHMPPDRDSPLP